MSKYLLTVCIVLFQLNYLKAQEKRADLEITSTNKQLTSTFNWAKNKARFYVQTGKKGPINISEIKKLNNFSDTVTYIPSYWAGYPLRSAFYSRDFVHQIAGAHLIGLEAENFSMLKAFATSATAQRKWYPLWAINFDGSTYNLDYRNDNSFVREVPAVFELVEKGYELYRWTGDKRYVLDDDLWKYYTKAVTDFVTIHDSKIKNGVAEGNGKNIFEGVATYNEQRGHPLVESGDGIASQYKAYSAYAKMAEIRGNKKLSAQYLKKAADLKSYFNKDWGVKNTDLYNRGYTQTLEPIAGWGKENSWFMPLKGITDASSERNLKYLDFIEEQLNTKEGIPGNIEALSYIPEVFFKYHQNERGWKWMKYIMSNIDKEHEASALTGKNGDYPEISYVFLSNVVEGMLGITPDASKNQVATISRLTDEIGTLGVKNIKIGSSVIDVEHSSRHISKVVYQNGKHPLYWKACFPGKLSHVLVNGVKKSCLKGTDSGQQYSYVIVKLAPNDTATVKTIGAL